MKVNLFYNYCFLGSVFACLEVVFAIATPKSAAAPLSDSHLRKGISPSLTQERNGPQEKIEDLGGNQMVTRQLQTLALEFLKLGDDIGPEDGSIAEFGHSVALASSNLILVVGARGLVRVFRWDGNSNTWGQMGQTICDGHTSCGESVAISGDGFTIAINNNENGFNVRDPTQVYRWLIDDDSWEKVGQDLDGQDGFDPDRNQFISLSHNGLRVAIGNHGNGDNGVDSGLVRIYDWSDTDGEWQQVGQDIRGVGSGEKLGFSVSLSGDGSRVAIGSNSDARVFLWYTAYNEWMDDIGALPVGGGDWVGFSVSLSFDGTIVAVGSPYEDNSAGHTRIFRWTDEDNYGEWNQMGNDIVGGTGDFSGSSVSLSSDGLKVAVGSPGYFSRRGITHIYNALETITGSWVWEEFGFVSVGEFGGDKAGSSVSLSGHGSFVFVATGAPEFQGEGQVRIHTTGSLVDVELLSKVQNIRSTMETFSSCIAQADNIFFALESIENTLVDDVKADVDLLPEIHSKLDETYVIADFVNKTLITDIKPYVDLLPAIDAGVEFIKDASLLLPAINSEVIGTRILTDAVNNILVNDIKPQADLISDVLVQVDFLPDIVLYVENTELEVSFIKETSLPEIKSQVDLLPGINSEIMTVIEPTLNILPSISNQVDLLPEVASDIATVEANVNIIKETSLPEIKSNVDSLPDIQEIAESINKTLVTDIKPDVDLLPSVLNQVVLLPEIFSSTATIEDGFNFINKTSLPEIKSDTSLIPAIKAAVESVDASLSENMDFEADHLPSIRETVDLINATLVEAIDFISSVSAQKLLEADVLILSKSEVIVLVMVGGVPTDTNENIVELSALSKSSMLEEIVEATITRISTGKYLLQFDSDGIAFWVKIAINNNERTVAFTLGSK